MAQAFIVTEDYNRYGRYRFTAFSSRDLADLHARAAALPENAQAYVRGTSPHPSWGDLAGLAEVHVQVHEVPWPEAGGEPAKRASVIGLSQQQGFSIQLIVVAEQHLGDRAFPWLDGWTPVCPEDEDGVLILDGPTFEGGDTAI